MNTPSNTTPSGVTPSKAVPESQVGSQAFAPALFSATRPFFWSIRRELWENRSIYIAPLVAAVVALFGSLTKTITLRHSHTLSPEQQHEALAMPYEMAGALIMGTAFIVGIFYTLDALYGERRDRSILFWKSLPVSDLTVVLSKLIIPLAVLPLLSFAITVVTQFCMLLLSSVVLLGSGLNVATMWTHSLLFHVSLMLLYHIVTVHGLWYAPFYGWMLLVSVGAPRAPFVWAFLPPFLIVAVENLTFNTHYFASMLLHRLTGPETPAPPNSSMMAQMAAITPIRFFSEPGLWIGLAIAAAFIFAAIRLRRYRGPI